MTEKKQLLIGAHISISGGFDKAIERGESIGCNAIQIFTKSNRQWHAKAIEKKDIDLFQIAWQESSIQQVIAHASYLINIGSPTKRIQQQSVIALKDELVRCQQLDIPYLVMHPGSHVQTTEQKCLNTIAHNLDIIFEMASSQTMILLETMAGQGSTVGYDFEHIKYIIERSRYQERLGVCFDTCHAFAAGYDLRDKKHYNNTWDLFNEIIGLKNLKVVHLNDSKRALGSRVDRHEHIGQGQLGLEAFRLLCTDHRLMHIPKILETPKTSLVDDANNIKLIKALIKK